MTVTTTTALPRRVRAGYGMGSVATGAFGTVPGLMLLPYLTDTIGLAAAIVTTQLASHAPGMALRIRPRYPLCAPAPCTSPAPMIGARAGGSMWRRIVQA